jgi:hypothetical protein
VQGFEQIPHVHCDPNSKSPVTTQAALFVACTIMMMTGVFVARVIDIKGAFLKGEFVTNNKVLLFKEVKQRNKEWFTKSYGEN